MPPVANSVRVVLSGTLGGGEIWSTGWWTLGNIPINEDQVRNLPANIADPDVINSWVSACLSAGCFLTSIDCYGYTGGSTTAAYQGHADINIAGSGTAEVPNQCALVVTTLSGLPGRSRRGRMYLPKLNTFEVGAPVRYADATVDAAVNACAAIMDDVAALGFPAIVMSATHSSSVPIVQVRGDDIVDTQRRREENTISQHQHSATVNGS